MIQINCCDGMNMFLSLSNLENECMGCGTHFRMDVVINSWGADHADHN